MTRHVGDLHSAVEDVVRAGNCSGCGACATLSPSLSMGLSTDGYARPRVDVSRPAPPAASVAFRAVCPGVQVSAPPTPPGGTAHPIFGSYISVWAAWATDDDIRWRGSSGGVLTALSSWLLERGERSSVIAAQGSSAEPARTEAVRIGSAAQLLATAGSRYAPVGNVELLHADPAVGIFVGKPCEVDAANRVSVHRRQAAPLLFSFFCAGVPSQHATDQLVAELGVDPAPAGRVKYRGEGWPGEFVVSDGNGTSAATTYQLAWGQRLGRELQERCKICPDGTGLHADISVGDFWVAGSEGYPVFEQRDGVSVAIARTARGDELLRRAAAAGVVSLEAIDVDAVAAVQPSQVRRRLELAGRLLGRRLAGRANPRYLGFGLVRDAARRPGSTLRAARGAYRRSREAAR